MLGLSVWDSDSTVSSFFVAFHIFSGGSFSFFVEHTLDIPFSEGLLVVSGSFISLPWFLSHCNKNLEEQTKRF